MRRRRLRQLFVLGLALSLLGIGVPAWSEDDPRSCNDLMSGDTPAYVVCRWMATPDEALDIARWWLANDGERMESAGPVDGIGVNCAEPGNVCPPLENDGVGDGQAHDGGEPDVEGAEDGGTPECKAGEECFVSPEGLSAEQISTAMESTTGQAVKTAVAAGLRVWVDAELADDWKAGKLDEAAQRVAALAAQPGVVGIRFTRQLGTGQTFQTAEEMDTFVNEATARLRKLAPGRKLAARTAVPLFGCGADDACKTAMTEKYPLLAPERIGAWLAKGRIDQLALDGAHLGTEYATWKIDAATAQRNQWVQVRARAWDAYAQIASEDATLTATGAPQLTGEQVTKAVTEHVASPIQDDAAETVTLPSRSENEQGQVSRLYGEKWAANATWDQLKKLTEVRPRLATLYDPAKPEVDAATDLKALAEVFGQVYVQGD
ncbi:hypothetical protein [Nonomuraea rhodomycinica]|uniref:Uncharacterized protein n=1 Tax=Nonomuraea rhodomycinica TaxID=1712872 RepID=A0A7Y6IUC5_9ACTN|nr:hypothetical protein [Nonomuraea rhodomycinica]NUW43239.1 hypothetical protein [Nonomuraea rhodomycinica]